MHFIKKCILIKKFTSNILNILDLLWSVCTTHHFDGFFNKSHMVL